MELGGVRQLRSSSVTTRRRPEDVEIAAAFGRRLRVLRKGAELTQEALAERAGLHPTFISNLERGFRVPTVVTLVRLADALDVLPGDIVDHLNDA